MATGNGGTAFHRLDIDSNIRNVHLPKIHRMVARMTRYHSRKFLLSVGIGLISSYLVYTKNIPPDIYRDIIATTVAAYIAGNVWQKKGGA